MMAASNTAGVCCATCRERGPMCLEQERRSKTADIAGGWFLSMVLRPTLQQQAMIAEMANTEPGGGSSSSN